MATRSVLAIACSLVAAAGPLAAQRTQADPHPTFKVGTAMARRGEVAYGTINVPAGVDSATSIAVAVVHGARPGPVLALLAGAHGSEYASIIALEKLIPLVRPADLAGTVIIVPLVNVPSFEQIVPHVNPVDGKNMNRFYPGSMTGTQTERASFLITREVVEQSDHVIDFHGGDIDEDLRPYSYWTPTGRAAQDSASRAIVLAFGLDHIIISTGRPTDPAASRYLENTATTRGKPSITVEAGRAGTTEPEDIQVLIDGSLNVMGHLGMLKRTVQPVASPVWISELVNVNSEKTGIFHPLVKRGTYVAKGMKLGYVTDHVGRLLYEAVAPSAGIVLYLRAVPSMVQGQAIASIGVVATR